ncbi:PEP-CTERM sorting domain-containing protein [Oceaniferula spumae]
MKKNNKTTTQRNVSNNRKAKSLLAGLTVIQLGAASTVCAGTVIIGSGGSVDPWATQGSVNAPLPDVPGGALGVGVNLTSTNQGTDSAGNWDVTASGSSSVAATVTFVNATILATAAQTNVTADSLQFKLDNSGIVGGLAQVPVGMTWTANLGLPSVAFEANTQYDVNFNLEVASGFLTNAVSLGNSLSIEAKDDAGNPVAGLVGGNGIDLLGLLGSNPSGPVTFTFTTGDTVPTGDIHLEFAATKGISAELLGLGSNYVEVTGLSMESNLVPEPSSTALIGLGAIALILRRRA